MDGNKFISRVFKKLCKKKYFQDEFKDIVFDRNPVKFKSVDAGVLIREKSIRDALHCKPFRYFMEYVAPDMLVRYPLQDPGSFAKGAIQSKADAKLCFEVSKEDVRYRKLEVNECSDNKVVPSTGQHFTLTWHRNLQHSNFDVCIANSLILNSCHYIGGNQLWKFDLDTSQIINPLQNDEKCITLDTSNKKLFMSDCNTSDINQKWNFGEKNLTALGSWETFGADLKTLKLS